ncbi:MULTISPECIES: quinone oxidoreductase [unclassified Rhizobium]|uniref:quinone oxidoreductase family protein n=1 Tax=unclassified Rhizobium TaxID=2613769 RepID=UPI001609165D|nr:MULTISPECIES: quinone oxidoreductase [unclassified Rhizobium]MBB3541041.1 NADPH2:quinone reductase [Rhizobium sp. BK399]MCS3741302.1 NADPH2:quinone reductase [Rhizobium sp. BK661]MCS4093755.1 NADPH2:quinone reductase [Rhizobium sp. BK176]
MDKVITLLAPGGIEQLQVSEQALQSPGADEIRIRHDAIGMNFLDIYHRRGLYALPAYPAILGVEGAGTVETVGSAVTDLKPGDRVAYAGAPVGAYAATRLLPAVRAIRLPDNLPSKVAAASMLKGLTAYMLLTKTYRVGPGTTILIHAAAGGLGSLLVRWAKHLGATVIGTVSSEEKADLARDYGTDHLIVGRDADLVAAVEALTDNGGVDVAYDGIGAGTLAKSIASVRPFGVVATIGQAGGPIPPVAVDALRPGKSLTHPSIMAYITDTSAYLTAAETVVKMLAAGITATIAREYALEEAAEAQQFLEAGRAAGSLILVP